jgi:terminase large subunit-like protein
MGPRLKMALALDPAQIMPLIGFEPDPWQCQVLGSTSERLLICCHRQAGKSTAVAALAVLTALLDPDSLTLIVAASQRQSGEMYRKIQTAYRRLGQPVPIAGETSTTLTLVSGSRIVSLPDSPDTIVGFSGPKLIIIDEAARTSDETYVAVSPMRARSRGRMVALSTPCGQRGWFYEAWHDPLVPWERIAITATENPRMDPHYLEEERQSLGDLWFGQEYLNQFNSGLDQVFATDVVNAAFSDEGRSLFPGGIRPSQSTSGSWQDQILI